MRDANALFRKWQGEAAMRQDIERQEELRLKKNDRDAKRTGSATDETTASGKAKGLVLIARDDARMTVRASKVRSYGF